MEEYASDRFDSRFLAVARAAGLSDISEQVSLTDCDAVPAQRLRRLGRRNSIEPHQPHGAVRPRAFDTRQARGAGRGDQKDLRYVGEHVGIGVANQPRLMAVRVEPIDLQTSAIFLAAPTAAAFDIKDVHSRSTISASISGEGSPF